MSRASSQRKLPATWNPARSVWETDLLNLHCGHAEPFLGTWPASGSMRNGVSSQRRRSALPTPASVSSSSPGRLLPTPTAGNPNDGESLESWEARRRRNLAKGINGNGQGTPLGIAVKLLPTPRTSDTNGAGVHGTGGPDLRTAISLLSTPTARDWKSGESNLMDRNARPLNEVIVNLLPTPTVADSRDTANFRPDGTPYGDGYGMTLTDATRLLPTPRASDEEKGGPNQRGSKGDLMLPSAVSQISNSAPETATSTGVPTAPPSGAGSGSLGDGPHGQLMFGDV